MNSKVVQMEPNSSKSGAKNSSNKRQKFIELAQKRTVNALKAIRVIGKLGNRSAYEYSDADVSKIVKVLNDEIEVLKSRMKSPGRSESIDFKL